MKICYIMRGLPGSGKSTLARKLVEGGVIHSTDDLRMRDGVYHWDPRETEALHRQNLDNFRESLSKGISPVVVDNTNIRNWEHAPYRFEAECAGYQVIVISVYADPLECAARNTHQVPEETILLMSRNWEPW